MTRTVHLHIGAPKSGTTYLQAVLEHNRDRLADAGVLVVGEQHVDRVQAALQVREDRRWKKLPADRQDMWGTLLRQIEAWPGERAVLSYELFCAAGAEQAARVLRDLSGYDVHLVLTARDLGRSLPSAWQERLKFGLTTPLADWEPPAADDPRSEWGWRTTDPSTVLERWAPSLATDHVHVVTVPRSGAAPDELWRRFAAACGLDQVYVDTDVTRANESLGAVQAETLRRVNQHLVAPLDTSREQARWLRDMLAHRVLVAQGGEPLAITDAQFAEATARAEAAVSALAEAGYTVHGDLADLVATRPRGRAPGDVGDDEVLACALSAIVGLLVEARADQRRPAPAPAPTSFTRRLAHRVAGPVVSRRAASTRQRIADLEREVMASRELQQRVAALQDVVDELLLPAALRDDALMGEALRTYRRESL